jgi:hypothetical protein
MPLASRKRVSARNARRISSYVELAFRPLGLGRTNTAALLKMRFLQSQRNCSSAVWKTARERR